MKKKTENEYMNREKNEREKGTTVAVMEICLLHQRAPHTRTYLPVVEFLPSTTLPRTSYLYPFLKPTWRR